jgi:uncharacterized protein involved in propanediol utilization
MMVKVGAPLAAPGRNGKEGENRASPVRLLQTGVGRAIAHHGELLQGVFESEDGRLHRGLITLPFAGQQAVATFRVREDGSVRTRPAKRSKAGRAVAITLEHLGLAGTGADLTIDSSIPIGHGYGSSTADVVAAIRAVACAAGITLRQSTICELAIAAEGASDAIAYGNDAVLFAHREGRILEHFGGEFPPFVVVGFRVGKPIDTLQLPRARYSAEEIQLFRVLRGLAYRSIKQQDPRMLGQVATISASISQRHLPKSRFETVLSITRHYGACGLQVAHSGTLIGILLDANQPTARQRAAALVDTLKGVGFRGAEVFFLNAEGLLTKWIG